jgi:predicted DNA-binding transcriptional regulator AlpA
VSDEERKNPLADYQTVTMDEICDTLCIKRRALDRIIAGDKTFPKELALPGLRRWSLSEVEAWLAAQATGRSAS